MVMMKPWLLAPAGLALVGGIAGGLLRVGVMLPGAGAAAWPTHASEFHAALMISAFLGTVIGIERAVALRQRLAFAAPLAAGLGGLAGLLGATALGAWLGVAAALVFVGVNVVVVRRQWAAHTALLLLGAAAWLVGNLLFAIGIGSAAALPWWFSFLVLTIAAERLEMTRLMRRGPAVGRTLAAVLALLLVGAGMSIASAVTGGVLFGLALTALAAWFGAFDIARRTVRAQGLSRYMALALLGGYAWLAVAGLAWIGMACGLPLRDAALHALGLGFVVSMMMGHAPVILPAIARIKLRFGAWFYLPLAALHVSLALRLGPGLADNGSRALGAIGNAAAIALFAATLVGAALAWRHQHRAPPRTHETPA
jgi:hypothetical protein